MTDRPARFSVRLAATAIDAVILLGLSAAAFVLLVLTEGDSVGTGSERLGQVVYTLSCLSLPAYLAIEPLTGRTPGKWAVGLRVDAGDGTDPTCGRRFARWGLKLVPWLLVPQHSFGGLVVAIPIVFDDHASAAAAIAWWILVVLGDGLLLGPSRRSLVDRLTGTMVLGRRPAPGPRGFDVLRLADDSIPAGVQDGEPPPAGPTPV